MGKGIIYILILFFFYNYTSAKNSYISNINTTNGLSQRSVNHIIQDGNGFLWFATNDGLNRYDGYSFKVFHVTEFDTVGFQNNHFNCVFEDSKGMIWFGAEAGLYQYSPIKDNISKFDFSSINAASDKKVSVVDIIQRSNGQLVVLTSHVIYNININTNEVANVELRNEQSNIVSEEYNVVYEDFQNRLWLGTNHGVYLLSEQTNVFLGQSFSSGLATTVNSFIATINGQLVAATDNGLYQLNKHKVFEPLTCKGLNSSIIAKVLYRDGENNIWLCTDGDGVFHLNSDFSKVKEQWELNHTEFGSTKAISIAEDEFGLIWFGTKDNGVYSLNISEQLIQQVQADNPLIKNVCSLKLSTKNTNSIWVGSHTTGVSKLIINNESFSVHQDGWMNELKDKSISDILEVGNFLIVATNNEGLIKIDMDSGTISSINVIGSSNVMPLMEANNLVLAGDDKIWFSSPEYGLCFANLKESKAQAYDERLIDKLDPNNGDAGKEKAEIITKNIGISTMDVAIDGNLYLGTNGNGLFQLSFSTNEPELVQLENKILSNIFMNCLVYDKTRLLIGSQGRGLYIYNIGNKTVQRLGKQHDLANEVVHAIKTDNEGNIWVSTNRGLSKYIKEHATFVNYSSTSYLQGHEFNNKAVCKSDNGFMFFAGNNGINYFLSSKQTSSSTPRIQIVDLIINNEVIKVGEEHNKRVVLDKSIFETSTLHIYPEDNVIGFNVVPVHYSDSKQNKFEYKLEPYETEWIARDAQNSFVNYHNLFGGNYTFKYRAQSSTGEWSEQESLTIIVHPPLWERFWFKVMVYLLGFALVGLLFGIWYFNQKSRQEQIEQERNMMQSLIDNIPDAIYFKDLQSNFTRVNKAQAVLLGFDDAKTIVGKSDFDFYDNAEETYQVEQEIIRTGIPFINQTRKQVIDEINRYFSETKIALYDIEQNCIGTVGVSRDITDVIKAREASLENQAKFKALFDNAPLAIFRINSNFEIVEYNYRFCDMFGYSKDENLNNLPTADLLVDPEISQLIFETVLETHEVNSEIMFKRTNGKTFIGNLTLTLLDEGFKETTIEGIIEDITHMAQARDEIIKAKDKAVEADKLKSLFLANMSHEIRTPMNAIIGFTNMLREDTLTFDDRNSFIDVIQSNGNNLMSLIDSIVDFSKLEAEQMSVSFSEFNFNSFFDSVFDHAKKLILSEEKTQIQLIRTIDTQQAIRITSDRIRLNQILDHLISNAVKFTDKGEIEIGCTVNNTEIYIYVRDTGIGIKENKLKLIFERFTKVNDDKNRLFGGTGIGLTISKGLVELMGGKIIVESKPNVGSKFIVSLPIKPNSNK